ncbi:MAG: hypothetical protein AAB874_06295 [Patescibacteria group bacterium]
MKSYKWNWVLLILIILAGLYLRFHRIETSLQFGWDQARDSWKVRDILVKHQLVLNGPRTGIGHFHLGPLYYYLLVPFYFFTNLDPSAANYFNILVNIFNFVTIYIVTKKLISSNAGLFATTLYAFNYYMINYGKIPWNVSLVPGVDFLIFYSLYKAVTGNYRWYAVALGLAGVFFHLHFTAVLFALIIPLTVLFVKDEKSALLWCIKGSPLLLIWLVPTVIYNIQSYQHEYFRYKEFLDIYLLKFHFRWLLHRIPDSLIQLEFLLFFKQLKWLVYLLPTLFALLMFREKDKNSKQLGVLSLVWLISTLIGFTFYSGPVSDYYFLLTLPPLFIMLLYLQQRLIARNNFFIIVLGFFWIYYFFQNTSSHLLKPVEGGLNMQRNESERKIRNGEYLPYDEGDIKSYFYAIWKEDGKEFWKK